MPKNTAVAKKFSDINDILKSEAKAKKLQAFIDEVVRCKQKILDENESIRALRESAVDELEIQPKMFNALVSLHFNNNFEEKREEIEQLDCAIDHMLRQVNGPQ